MQKRKREDTDPILPLRAPKHQRVTIKVHPTGENSSPSSIEGLGARWMQLGMETLKLLRETIVQIFNSSPGDEDKRPAPHALPSPPPSPDSAQPTSRPPPRTRQLSRPPIPTFRFETQPGSSKAAPKPVPSPPEQHAGPSHVDAQRVPLRNGVLSPPSSQNTQASDSPSSSIADLHPQMNDVLREAHRRKNSSEGKKKYQERPHILSKAHKLEVTEKRKQIWEENVKEAYERHRERGYSSNLGDFRSLVHYRAKLSGLDIEDILSPSASLTNLRERRANDSLRRHSDPNDFNLKHLQRALDRVDATLKGPKPAPTPTLDQLRQKFLARSVEIERRIHGPKPLPATLPPEDEVNVDALFTKRGVIAKCAREQVTDKDISRLRPHQWLNDEIINFYGQMILSRSEESKENPADNAHSKGRKKPLNVHYFSTFFWSKLKNDGYDKGRLAKWTKKIDIFSKDVILIPVNHNNAHWTAAAINFRRKRIESYDSMGMDHRTVYKLLRGYLDAEHRNKKKKPFDFTGWEDYVLTDTPQQENGYDCGVFTCQFLEAVSRGEEEFAFDQTNMPYLRRRMVWEIGNVKLRDDP